MNYALWLLWLLLARCMEVSAGQDLSIEHRVLLLTTVPHTKWATGFIEETLLGEQRLRRWFARTRLLRAPVRGTGCAAAAVLACSGGTVRDGCVMTQGTASLSAGA